MPNRAGPRPSRQTEEQILADMEREIEEATAIAVKKARRRLRDLDESRGSTPVQPDEPGRTRDQ